jgi:hypothetical protein
MNVSTMFHPKDVMWGTRSFQNRPDAAGLYGLFTKFPYEIVAGRIWRCISGPVAESISSDRLPLLPIRNWETSRRRDLQ